MYSMNRRTNVNEEIINYELQEIANQIAFESTMLYFDEVQEELLYASEWTNNGPGWDD